MGTNTSKLSPTELDFDLIKKELKNYLASQSEFTEYNFEGSAMNVLMDIMSYNTHMNAFMANMMANEMFLDTSSIRESVVSKAKEIGYITRSVRASKANVDVSVANVSGAPPYLVMDAGTQFQTNHDIIFSTKEELLLYPTESNPTTYVVEEIDIYEGRYTTFKYEYASDNIDQRIVVPDVNADISTLIVTVRPSIGSTESTEYFVNDDINKLTPDSEIYFLNEDSEGYWEIVFGDGILGKNLENGNYITLSYIISSHKTEANDINYFVPYQRIDTYSGDDIYIGVNEPSYGGAEKESINEIKFLAPKFFQSQKRAVTTQDYEAFLLHDYPWIDTINSWGGESNIPPIYGKVFFSIKPKHTEFISTKLKEEIKEDLIKKYNVVTVVPEIVDPDYIYINIDNNSYYYRAKTTKDKGQLAQEITDNINQYFDDTTKKFKMDFRFSPMSTIIDSTDTSIDNSLTNVYIHKRIYPITNLQQTFEINFNNALIAGTIESSYYNVEDALIDNLSIEAVIKDDGNGIMQIMYASSGIIINDDIGTVDYDTGLISITIFPYALPLDTLDIRLYATPKEKNIQSGYNQIIKPDDSAVNPDLNRMQGVKVVMNEIN